MDCRSTAFCELCEQVRAEDPLVVPERRIRVHWQWIHPPQWYTGTVASAYRNEHGHVYHYVKYDDGDRQWHLLRGSGLQYQLEDGSVEKERRAVRESGQSDHPSAKLGSVASTARSTVEGGTVGERSVFRAPCLHNTGAVETATPPEAAAIILSSASDAFFRRLIGIGVSNAKSLELATHHHALLQQGTDSSKRNPNATARSLTFNLQRNATLLRRLESCDAREVFSWTSDNMMNDDVMTQRNERQVALSRLKVVPTEDVYIRPRDGDLCFLTKDEALEGISHEYKDIQSDKRHRELEGDKMDVNDYVDDEDDVEDDVEDEEDDVEDEEDDVEDEEDDVEDEEDI